MPIVVAHPPPPGRPLERWKAGPLREAREQGVVVAVENMPQSRAGRYFQGQAEELLPARAPRGRG